MSPRSRSRSRSRGSGSAVIALLPAQESPCEEESKGKEEEEECKSKSAKQKTPKKKKKPQSPSSCCTKKCVCISLLVVLVVLVVAVLITLLVLYHKGLFRADPEWRTRTLLDSLQQSDLQWNSVVETPVPAPTPQPFRRVLWAFWHEPEEQANKFMRGCMGTFHSKNPSWTVRILREDKLMHFVNFHELKAFEEVKEFSGLAAATDLLRLVLLWRFGGVWLDASSVFTGMNSLDELLKGRGLLEADTTTTRSAVVMRMREWSGKKLDGTVDEDRERVGPIIESWFIAARPQSRFVGLWLKQFIRYQNVRMKSRSLHGWFRDASVGFRKEFKDKGFVDGSNDLWRFEDYLTVHWSVLYAIQEERRLWMEEMWSRSTRSRELDSEEEFDVGTNRREIMGVQEWGVAVESTYVHPRTELGRLIRAPQYPYPIKGVDRSKEAYFTRLRGANPALELSLGVEILDCMLVAFGPQNLDPRLWSKDNGRAWFDARSATVSASFPSTQYFVKFNGQSRAGMQGELGKGRRVEIGSILDKLGLREELNG